MVHIVFAAALLLDSVERLTVPNGGELITVFDTKARIRTPVLSYLKDTLGDEDPSNDKLRQVWILTRKRQSLGRHLLAAIPFLYTRFPSKTPRSGRVPRPALDLSRPYESTVGGVLQQVLQVVAIDPLGSPYRAASRSYRMNRSEQRELGILDASAALGEIEGNSELRDVRSRLLLSSHLLGGMVSDSNLALVHEKEAIRLEEMRGRNWELLRQQAERNHLIFEPLRIGGGQMSHVLLSVAVKDLEDGPRPFRGRFLKIANPWTRGAIPENRLLKSDRIPLALYSLEHPKIPYLVADLRHNYAPRRREVSRRAVQDVAVGVFGISRFANLQYFAASWFWNFMSDRRGANNNRAWRLRSYAELRRKLSVDTALDPDLRAELLRRTASLALNPLEDPAGTGAEIARVQYSALVRRASEPRGLPLLLERNRREEAALISRAFHRRTAVELLRLASFGLYRKHGATSSAMLVAIDRHRRIQTHTRHLEQVIASGPITEVTLDLASVKHSVQELSRLTNDGSARGLLQRLASRTLRDSPATDGLISAIQDAQIGDPQQ